MQAVTFSEARKNLKKYFDKVYTDHNPLIITRKNNENVVVLSMNDYNSILETQYLLSSKNNSKRLLSSLNKVKSNKIKERKLLEE